MGDPRGPRWRQDCPRGFPEGPKRVQENFLRAPRGPDSPKRAKEGSQMAPRGLQDGSKKDKMGQEGCKRALGSSPEQPRTY